MTQKLSKPFLMALLANFIWTNISEIFRYFVFVMPMMRDAFPQIEDVAPMSIPVFMVWSVWGTILLFSVTGISWLYLEKFGASIRNAVIAGTYVWLTIFVLLWLGLYNMNLAEPEVILIALPLAWIEMVVCALIVRWFMHRFP